MMRFWLGAALVLGAAIVAVMAFRGDDADTPSPFLREDTDPGSGGGMAPAATGRDDEHDPLGGADHGRTPGEARSARAQARLDESDQKAVDPDVRPPMYEDVEGVNTSGVMESPVGQENRNPTNRRHA